MNEQDYAEVLSFIDAHPAATLSTVSDEGMPHGATIFVVADEQLHFYFVTRLNTRKYTHLLRTSHIALTITDVEKLQTVQVEATTEDVTDETKHDFVLKKLSKVSPTSKTDWLPPVTQLRSGGYVVVEATPSSLRYADFSSNPEEGDPFVQIIGREEGSKLEKPKSTAGDA